MCQSNRPGAAQTSRPLHEGQAKLCIRAKIDDRWKMVSAMAPDRTVLPQGLTGDCRDHAINDLPLPLGEQTLTSALPSRTKAA